MPHPNARAALWRTLLVAAVLWAILPPLAEAPGSGLDRSWVIAVQLAGARGLVWGRDLMWTYGPLGAIAHPVAGIEGHLPAATGRLVLTAAHALAAAFLLWRSRRHGLVAATGIASALALSGVLGIADAAILVVLAVSMGAATVGRARPRTIAAASGASAAALALLIKFNLGVLGAASAMLWAITEVGGATDRAPALKRAMAVAGTGLGVLAGAWMATGAPLAALGAYLRDGVRLIAGFSAQLAIAGPGSDLALATAMSALLVLAVIATSSGRSDRRLLLVLAPLAFGLFKASFVRHDLHAAHWFVTAPALAAPLAALASPARASRYGVAVLGMALVSGAWFATRFPPPLPWPRGAAHLVALVETTGDPHVATAASADLGTEPPAEHVLPDRWHALIGSESADAYPWDLAELEADGIAWQPRYVPQSYQAYHAALDRTTARGMEEAGPAFVVYRVAAVDELHPAMVDPATWLALWDRYDLLDERDDRMLLARREQARIVDRRGLPCPSLVSGQLWRMPPAGGRPLLASIEVAPTPLGSLTAALWRLLPPTMEIRRFDGSSSRRRVAWHALRNGILASHLPDGPASLRPLFAKAPPPHAVSEIVLHADRTAWRAVSPVRCEVLVVR